MPAKKVIDYERAKRALAELDRIAREHPELIDTTTPREQLEKEWEEELEGILGDKDTLNI